MLDKAPWTHSLKSLFNCIFIVRMPDYSLVPTSTSISSVFFCLRITLPRLRFRRFRLLRSQFFVLVNLIFFVCLDFIFLFLLPSCVLISNT
ncbi:uncharacterized protein F5147DRAFT_25498 [Suillus discolor]|uniref:Transmembrane protein n=1 Tax=Suillus discolor TaxID=1912936 RepID=A0A9P7ETT3_9AGAM|nr:uncharacterized protein F5147DRAFT_25498 [Suillus discolor]KAG2090739.1 hypothetical protein F5147DRAFT_25498 [Suillus discolor]